MAGTPSTSSSNGVDQQLADAGPEDERGQGIPADLEHGRDDVADGDEHAGGEHHHDRDERWRAVAAVPAPARPASRVGAVIAVVVRAAPPPS